MKMVWAFLLGTIVIFGLAACDSSKDQLRVSEDPYQQGAATSQNTSFNEQPVEQTKVDWFIMQYNATASNPITDTDEVNITDEGSAHYRMEFRLGAFSNAYAKTGVLKGSMIDVVSYGVGNQSIRVYANDIDLELAKEIVKTASQVLDESLTDEDINEVLEYIDENQEANGYYYGDIGLLLLGKKPKSYELMLKVE